MHKLKYVSAVAVPLTVIEPSPLSVNVIPFSVLVESVYGYFNRFLSDDTLMFKMCSIGEASVILTSPIPEADAFRALLTFDSKNFCFIPSATATPLCAFFDSGLYVWSAEAVNEGISTHSPLLFFIFKTDI